jgi:hypothetical protein
MHCHLCPDRYLRESLALYFLAMLEACMFLRWVRAA